MYCAFYGLREPPFALTSNPKYFLMTRGHEEALSNLRYGLAASTGITLLLGEAGTGKTSVLRKGLGDAIDGSSATIRIVHVNNPTLSAPEFVDTLAHGFQLSAAASSSKSQLLRELEHTLLQHRDAGRACALVVDEAQSLPNELLEEVRLLTNMEAGGERLLRIVLAGQPSLGVRLNQPGLLQLKQRIDLRYVLPPLTLHEVAAYIAGRITIAGGVPGAAFSREAVATIHQRSRGVPRTINVLCGNALLSSFPNPIGHKSLTIDSPTIP